MIDKEKMAAKPSGKTEHRTLFGVMLVMIIVLVAATMFTLAGIEKTMPAVLQQDPEASPLGYTRSLTLVYLPIFVLLWWFKGHPQHQSADWVGLKHTLYFLVPLWSLVDIFAASSIFRFPNCNATLEWYVPGWLPDHGFVGKVPIEEFFFYLGASLLFLLLYIWSKTVWFQTNAPRVGLGARARACVPFVGFKWSAAGIGVAIVAVAALYKHYFSETPPELLQIAGCQIPQSSLSGSGFPLYLTLLLIVAVGPAALLWRKMILLINVQAMLFAALTGVLVSLMWEVTLALPYGWWDYNAHWMLGVFIKPWYGLPVEAALLWVCAGMGSIILFELFRAQYASGLSFWHTLFGPAISGSADDDSQQ